MAIHDKLETAGAIFSAAFIPLVIASAITFAFVYESYREPTPPAPPPPRYKVELIGSDRTWVSRNVPWAIDRGFGAATSYGFYEADSGAFIEVHGGTLVITQLVEKETRP